MTTLHVFICVYTEPAEAKTRESVEAESNTTAANVSSEPAAGFLEHFSQSVALLSSMSSVLELLSQAAESSLDEQERQVEQVASNLSLNFFLKVMLQFIVSHRVCKAGIFPLSFLMHCYIPLHVTTTCQSIISGRE